MKSPSYHSLWWNLIILIAAGIAGSVAGVYLVGGIGGAIKGFGVGILIAIVVSVGNTFGLFQ